MMLGTCDDVHDGDRLASRDGEADVGERLQVPMPHGELEDLKH